MSPTAVRAPLAIPDQAGNVVVPVTFSVLVSEIVSTKREPVSEVEMEQVYAPVLRS